MSPPYLFTLSGTLKQKACILGAPQPPSEGSFWFNEGLATVLSGQLASWGNGFKFNFEKYPRFELILRPSGSYVAAATAVEYLMMAFGRGKILEALRRIPANASGNLDESNRVLFETLGLQGETKAMHEKKWKEATLKKYAAKD